LTGGIIHSIIKFKKMKTHFNVLLFSELIPPRRASKINRKTSYLFIALILLFALSPVVTTSTLHAQTPLNIDATAHSVNYSGTFYDFQVPNDLTLSQLVLSIRGGDGGYARIDDDDPIFGIDINTCRSNGGQGAYVSAVFNIGPGVGEIPYGSIIRFIIGESGNSYNKNITWGTDFTYGGGGGGSAILFRAPGSSDWEILEVAGGGGGAYQGMFSAICVDNEDGQGGRSTTFGGNGNGDLGEGSGGNNGYGGEGSAALSGAGGGAYGNGTGVDCVSIPDFDGFHAGEGHYGGTIGGSGGDSDGCLSFPFINGGFGFGGGGAGSGAGGGGGGYSGGGGGGTTGRGGGGGSYLNPIGTGTITAGDTKYTPEHGYATYQAILNDPPVAVCIGGTLSVFLDENGLASITAEDIDNGSYDPEGGQLILSVSPDAFDCNMTGLNTVTLSVTDNTDQTVTCTASVLVVDDLPPVAVCKDFTLIPDAVGDYNIIPADIDDNSLDNCGIASMSVSPAFIPCFHDALQQTVSLFVTDNSGNSSQCSATVTLSGDSDCDGVGDYCDLCPGGNDQVDVNEDGYPDCHVFPGISSLIPEWKCGNALNKVTVCHLPPGNTGNSQTICVSPEALPAHLAHGDYIGPCNNASCLKSFAVMSQTNSTEGTEISVYPNPARDEVIVNISGFQGAEGRISLYNMMGEVVYQAGNRSLSDSQYLIPVNSLSNGLYSLQVSTPEAIKMIKLTIAR
jgi:hypothetical protein